MASKLPFQKEISDTYDFMAYVIGQVPSYTNRIDFGAFPNNITVLERFEHLHITEDEIDILATKMCTGVPITPKEEIILKYITSESEL